MASHYYIGSDINLVYENTEFAVAPSRANGWAHSGEILLFAHSNELALLLPLARLPLPLSK